jgi:hypothetical protein
MKGYLLFLLTFISMSLFAQKLKVTAVNDNYFHHEKVEGFICLHDEMPDYGFTWIGTIRMELDTIVRMRLEDTYKMAQERANRLGANAFKVKDADIFSFKGQKFIEFDIYHLRMENRDENRALFYSKSFYLFGFLGHHRNMEGYTVKLNGEKLMLDELSFYTFQPAIGTEVVVEIGGWFKKGKHTYRVAAQELSRYFSFQMYRGLFRTHEINEYDWSFGEYLLKVLKKKSVPAEVDL